MDYILILSGYLRSIFLTILLGLGIYFLINIGNKHVQEGKKFVISRKAVINTIIAVIFLVAIYNLFKGPSSLTQILMLVFYSIILAYLLNPLVNIIERKRVSRSLSVLLVYLILVAFILIVSFSIVPKLASEFQSLAKVLPTQFNKIYDFFNELYIKYSSQLENLPPEFNGIREVLLENLNRFQSIIISSLKGLTNSVIKTFSKVVSLVIIPILTFYFLKDKEYFKKKIYLLIPKKYRNDTLRLSREIDSVLSKFIRGQLIVAAFVGVATTIGLLIIGVDFAIIIGMVAGIADIIPYFGPIIGILPALLFALLESPIKAVWVIIVFVVIQQLEGNIVAPKIVGESVGLHPVIVMLALLIGGSYFGILGMLLAVPLAAIIKITSGFIVEKLSKV
ncbi:AI-2E family transporter [Brassicibacter mesophilus]|jgi:sporulation integral membrane protein YtvI|uniref:AI-2E family transporter n=1 Tax=Brassicibacter mesophilus TaxID=745119 RepID=UPI003D1D6BF8